MDYHQGYDEVDAPVYQRKPKAKNTFQRELDAKLKQRRNLGLAADVTPSEGSDDDEDDIIAQYTNKYNASSKSPRLQRPGSAKHRPERPDDTRYTMKLDQTLRPKDAENLLKYGRDDSLDREVASYGNKNLPHMGGSAKTPSPKSDSIFGRKTPTGKKTPTEEPLTKEEIIFGRKTPTQGLPDSIGKKPWTPPSYQKPGGEVETGIRTPSPAGSRGRNTPSSLDPISESNTPRSGPRSSATTPRGGDVRARPRLIRQGDIDKSPRQFSPEATPRPAPRQRVKTPETEPPKGRTTPNIDLFGKTRQEAGFDDLEKPEKEARFERQDGELGRKTPTRKFGGRKTPENVSGRKTPTGLFGRKTPEQQKADGKKSPTGRKTPAGRKTPPAEEKVEKKPENKSLLDFLTEDVTPSKPQPKPANRRKKSLTKEQSGDSITDEIMPEYRRSPVLSHKTPPVRRDGSLDNSSICEELDKDPESRRRVQEEAAEDAKKKSIRQSSAQQAVDSAISNVADAQNKTEPPPSKDTTKKRPKTGDSKHRPKPRYPTLPGETTPITEVNFEDTASIRQAIYDQWYRARMEKAKKELSEKKKKEKEEEEKKKQEKEEKATEAKLSYNAWVEQKKDTYDKEKLKRKRQEEKKREKEMEEKEDKRKAAEGSFKIWKERKDEVIVDKTRRLKREEENKKQEEQEKKQNRVKDSETAFRGWKNKKDVVLMKKAKEEKMKQKQVQKEEEEMKITKDEEAMNRYQEWLRNKERNDMRNRRTQSLVDMEERPPWSPANKTIPFGH